MNVMHAAIDTPLTNGVDLISQLRFNNYQPTRGGSQKVSGIVVDGLDKLCEQVL